MKIIVFSDSHTDVDTMCEVVDVVDPGMIIHLGDHVSDAIQLQNIYREIPMEFVSGNTDFAETIPSKKIIAIKNTTLFICHGNEYNVKEGLDQIIKAGRANMANIVLFGHTHKPYLKKHSGIWFMNPGRIGRKSSKKINATFGIIELNDDIIECKIFEYDLL